MVGAILGSRLQPQPNYPIGAFHTPIAPLFLGEAICRDPDVVVKCTNRIIRMMRMPPGRIMWLWLQSGAQYRANH